MNGLDPIFIILAASAVVILSYFCNILAKRTNIPSVLMLIILGVLISQFFPEIDRSRIMPYLHILGTVGLIMIVLEAALDLELRKEKWGIIWRSFAAALVGLIVCTFVLAFLIHFFLIDDQFKALIYAIPLSIMSSAIIIPSVINLPENKREFMVYEGTFSDILGIIFFYSLKGNAHVENTQAVVVGVTGNIFLTIVLSVVLSYGLVLIFQKIRSQVKLFLLISVLTLLYSIGKMFHLSSLIIILVFGLILRNHHLFFRGMLAKMIDKISIREILHNFHLITAETAFVVRTFFFVAFGLSISLASLLSLKYAIISVLIVLAIYLVRYATLKLFRGKQMQPELFLAPRGLITILLFYAIPAEYMSKDFDESILLFTILASSIIMSMSLVRFARKSENPESMLATEAEEEGEKGQNSKENSEELPDKTSGEQ